MRQSFDGQHVLIVGGSSGFGLEIARLAGAAGASLHLVGRDPQKARAVAATFAAEGIPAKGYGLDASQPAALEICLDSIGAPLSHAVSMLGGAMGGGFLEADMDTIRNAIEEKFFAALMLARVVVPRMAEGGSLTLTAGAGGRPDNASGAIVGNANIGLLVRGLAVEAAPKLRVNAVAPTWTPTPLWRSMAAEQVEGIRARFAGQIPLGRVAEPAEVAEAYLFAMRCGFLTGQVLKVDGGLELVT
ncbi:SDR family oxidoreductase [Poseidonocella sp. HB161398]|uniref:SDR family oxidoreductase n=1 Tax=Poseidonocella sp. HB161398 TaxID=2320855 RepID=UPI0011091D92|nr:SDR family oxidoreductase [Poseidonocella sp. HB161398]